MATQMEAPVCVDCKGAKTVAFRTCDHQGNCPCGSYVEQPCQRCEGSGVEGCDFCGEPAAGLWPYTKQPACRECLDREQARQENGPPDSENGEAWWGGANELNYQLQQARLLK